MFTLLNSHSLEMAIFCVCVCFLCSFCVFVFPAGGHLTTTSCAVKVLHDTGSGAYSVGILVTWG